MFGWFKKDKGRDCDKLLKVPENLTADSIIDEVIKLYKNQANNWEYDPGFKTFTYSKNMHRKYYAIVVRVAELQNGKYYCHLSFSQRCDFKEVGLDECQSEKLYSFFSQFMSGDKKNKKALNNAYEVLSECSK